eukprot:COSAG02_NODE_4071_length_5831_cov_8.855199_3_plen_122_part_00
MTYSVSDCTTVAVVFEAQISLGSVATDDWSWSRLVVIGLTARCSEGIACNACYHSIWGVLPFVCTAAVPIALPNTVTHGGYTGSWAAGLRAPAITVALSGGWANATLEGWTMGLTALFPQE